MAAEFFEGPEKKFELVVAPGRPSLRELGDACWERVVGAARAQVLSKRSTAACDAYLLSESSLFVSDTRLTMITCGRTRIAAAAEAVLEVIPPEAVAFFTLERKNEHFPREQPTTFEEDARRIAAQLPGVALRFGDEHSHNIRLFHTTRPFTPDADDTTLEVLMHGVEEASPFGGADAGAIQRARASGVGEILPGFELDDHVFAPRGYSLNALRGAEYYTVHVSPETVGSYVSFETNADFRADPQALVRRVIDIFRPESFDVLAFVPGEPPLSLELEGHRLRKHVTHELCGYGISFLHFYRPAPRPGGPTRIELE